MNERRNLDFLAATAAQQICEVIGKEVKNKEVEAKDVENLVTKALGVLQNHGVYAMALFLFSRSGKETESNQMSAEERIAVQILAGLWPLREPREAKIQNGRLVLDKAPLEINSAKKEMLNEFRNLGQDLDTLLLVRDLYEQTLIYARYHAKAMKGKERQG